MNATVARAIFWCRLIVGVVFVIAGASKATGMPEFIKFLNAIPILNIAPVWFAIVIVAFEVVLGAALILSPRPYIPGLLATTALVGFTVFQIVLPHIVSSVTMCPCIKVPLLQELDANATFRIIRNIVLLALSAVCWLPFNAGLLLHVRSRDT